MNTLLIYVNNLSSIKITLHRSLINSEIYPYRLADLAGQIKRRKDKDCCL